jgi:dTDP-4-dehydrorhamnose 3,5-epimerase
MASPTRITVKFIPAELQGAYLIEVEPSADERGWFGRIFDRDEFSRRGLASEFVQQSVSFNLKAHTLRGMHYLAAPYQEVKLIRCTAGRAHEVIVDMRPASPTYMKHFATELSADTLRLLYVPAGVAHGFLTLADRTELHYQMSIPFVPEAYRGVRWNDPALEIEWPARPKVILTRDASYPDIKP